MAGDEAELLEAARSGARLEADAVAAAATAIDEGVVLAAGMIVESAGKTFIVGSGTSGTIARRLAHVLSVSGTPGVFLHPMDALHGAMGAVEPEDVLIALSRGGESEEINRLCAILGEQGTPIIGVGEAPESTLAGLSTLYIRLRTLEGADPENTLAMGSTLVTALWCDALVRVLLRMTGWSAQRSLRIHPAGAVGRRADTAGSEE